MIFKHCQDNCYTTAENNVNIFRSLFFFYLILQTQQKVQLKPKTFIVLNIVEKGKNLCQIFITR